MDSYCKYVISSKDTNFSEPSLFNEGVDAYLNLLRNVTPQILLLTLLLVLYTKLDFTVINIGNWKLTFIFYAFFTLFIAAFVANSCQFIKIFYDKPMQWELQFSSYYRNKNYTKLRKFKLIFRLFFNHKIKFLEIVFIGASIPLLYLFIAFSAFFAAANVCKLLRCNII
jgi:hypothetical protein